MLVDAPSTFGPLAVSTLNHTSSVNALKKEMNFKYGRQKYFGCFFTNFFIFWSSVFFFMAICSICQIRINVKKTTALISAHGH